MKRPVKTGLSIAAGAAGLLVAAVILVLLLFPKDRVRQLVVGHLEAALKRPVAIRSADYALFPSVRLELKDVQVGERAEPGKPRIAVESIRLRMRLLPLLRRKVVVTKIELDRPLVDMISGSPQAQAVTGGAPPPPTGAPMDLQVQRFSIENGKITLRLPDGAPLVEVAGLSENLTARLTTGGLISLQGQTVVDTVRFHMVGGVLGEGLRIRLDKVLRYDLAQKTLTLEKASLDLAGLPIAVQGSVTGVGTDEPSLDLSLRGGPGQVSEIVALLPTQIFPRKQGLRSSGTLRVDGTVRGPAKKADFRVALSLQDGRIEDPALPQPIEGIRLQILANPDSIEVQEFTARAGGSSLRARAMLTGYQKVPHFLLAADADLDLTSLSGLYATNGMQISGRASAQVIAEGRADKPESMQMDGTLRLSSVGIRGPQLTVPVEGVDGELVFNRQVLSLRNLSARMGSSDLSASGSVKNFAALQPPGSGASAASGRPKALPSQGTGIPATSQPQGRATADLSIRSRVLNLDELVPKTRSSGMILPPLPPLDGILSVAAGRILFNNMEATQASGRIRLDHGIARLEGFGLSVFGGKIGLNGRLDLTQTAKPGYEIVTDVQGVDAHGLFSSAKNLNRFSQLGGYLSGRINSHAEMKGTLTDSLMLDPLTLTSSGNMELLGAQLAGYPLQMAVAGFLKAPQLESLGLSDWKQNFKIEDGKVKVDHLSLRAGETELLANGWQALDGTMEMHFDLMLPPSLAEGARSQLPAEAAGILFGGGPAKVFLPLVLSGRANSPSVSLDGGRLTQAAKDRAVARIQEEKALLEQEAKKQAGKMLQGLVGGKDTSAVKQPQEQIKEEVKSRLGRLLKGK